MPRLGTPWHALRSEPLDAIALVHGPDYQPLTAARTRSPRKMSRRPNEVVHRRRTRRTQIATAIPPPSSDRHSAALMVRRAREERLGSRESQPRDDRISISWQQEMGEKVLLVAGFRERSTLVSKTGDSRFESWVPRWLSASTRRQNPCTNQLLGGPLPLSRARERSAKLREIPRCGDFARSHASIPSPGRRVPSTVRFARLRTENAPGPASDRWPLRC